MAESGNSGRGAGNEEDWERARESMRRGATEGFPLHPRILWLSFKESAEALFARGIAEGLIREGRSLKLLPVWREAGRGVERELLGFEASLRRGSYVSEEERFPLLSPGARGRWSRRIRGALSRIKGESEEALAGRLRSKALEELFEWIARADWKIALAEGDADAKASRPRGLQALLERSELSRAIGQPETAREGKPKRGI